MTNFDKIKEMNIYELAKQNVRHLTTNIGYTPTTFYITSDGFDTTNKQEAIDYELDWLSYNID